MVNTTLAATLNPRTWRTQETHDKYEHGRKADLTNADYCPMCEAETIKEFTHWRIIENKYPYDAVAQTHHMLLPTRHCLESELTAEEIKELLEVKLSALDTTYTFIFEALPREKSVPGHHHLHLLKTKKVG